MPLELRLLAYSAILTWLMIVTASLVRSGGSLAIAFGNRDDVPPPTPVGGRADRAAKNMLENLALFTAVTLAAGAGGSAHHDRVVLGARIFFWARVAYWPVYLAGIKYLRTALWFASILGMAVMLSAVL
ncbi:MAG TPA: MAPEG family protein [Kofleriaceae bacterium]|nr:MAPEG family protein [Kofleriaceae bacterium]